MTNKEKIVVMLLDIHRFGVEVDRYDFGLPVHNEDKLAAMVKLVEDFLKTVDNVQNDPIEIDCFEVYMSDGYSEKHVAYVKTEEIAKHIVGKNQYLGYKDKKTFHIHNSIKSYEQNALEKKIDAAKAKLTPEELELLGLK